ncbi:DUF6177 family protein [Streptomyces sp. NPDC048361]|uniref:DUF6177 family protein n=1 Tax=Streptomyces sp. NPDC048361 TaxID=3154720 RepID=UPI0034391AA3
MHTDRASVVVQDRSIIALTTWLSNALAEAADRGRELQIVTPPTSRLALPTRTALAVGPRRWVVQHPETGYYDGLRGTRLHWNDGAFTEEHGPDGTPCVAAPFTTTIGAPTPEGERQVAFALRTVHPATADLVLGGALEATWQHLTGAPPTGWGTAEPVNLPWSKRELTELARTRAQKGAPTVLITLGTPEQPAIATTRIAHTPAGIQTGPRERTSGPRRGKPCTGWAGWPYRSGWILRNSQRQQIKPDRSAFNLVAPGRDPASD